MSAEHPEAPADGDDAAWVRVPAPLPPEELSACLDRAELLLRLNPYYHFRSLRRTGPASFHAEFRNDSNDREVSVAVSAEREATGTLTLRYDRGIKDRTVFRLEPAPAGALLTITDCYDRLPREERAARVGEVDRSLPAWGESLRVYFQRLRRWSWLPGWRWYIQGPWLRMTPAARRIVWLLVLITLAEFVFFLFVLLVYVIEH